MRFSTAFALPLLAATAVVATQQCTCWDDGSIQQSSGGASAAVANTGNSAASSGNSGSSSSSSSSTLPAASIVPCPKVKATEDNLTQGAAAAVQGLTAQNVIPADTAAKITEAVNQVIKKHAKKQHVVKVKQSNGTTTTMTVTPVPTVVTSTVSGSTGVETILVTKTITALPAGATILSNQTLTALENIQDAVDDAIAAVNLSMTGLDASAQAELQTCLRTVLENGGLPEGYSCISQTGSTSAGLQSTFNNVLEQFLGILPAQLIDNIQDAVMPMLSGLLPDEKTLLGNINGAISSVVSSLSGNSVTALEMMESCYSMAIKQNSNTSYLQCYMSDNGPFETLQTSMNSVIQQFVGVLPGDLIASVQNLTASTLQKGAYEDVSGIAGNLSQQLNAALASVTSSLSGNAVTLTQELQTCMNEVLINANVTAAANCISQAPSETARTMVNSVAEQFSGYLPSSFFSDLVSVVDSMNSTGTYSKDQIVSALDKAFNNANIGPAYTGCFEQVQTCLLNEIQASGNTSSVCAGPVTGCELIGSQNSTTLANATADASVSSSASAATATIVDSTVSPVNSTATISTEATVLTPVAAYAADSSSAASSSYIESSSASASAASSSVAATESASSASSSSSSSSSESSSASASSSSASSSASSEAASETSAPAATASNTTRHKQKRNFGKLRLMYEDHYNRS